MGGLFGIVTTGECIEDLFFGTDYHSHLGTKRGGLAVDGSEGLRKVIHNIENAQFRSKFRDLIAKMKLIPIRDLLEGQRLLFAEDSIVRGTQLQDTIQRLYDCGAKEVHMRPACPPLVYSCKFLNFSQSRSELDLAARKAINEIEGTTDKFLDEYTHPGSEKHVAMVEKIRERLKLTSLKYQRLPDLVEAIGLPKERLCTYCWDGAE